MKRIYRPFLLMLVAATAFAQQASIASSAKPTTTQPPAHKPDRAAAYYHYAMAHMYEEQVAMYGRSELANKAIEEYRLAIEADPNMAAEYTSRGNLVGNLLCAIAGILDQGLNLNGVLRDLLRALNTIL
jgi:hypothetical protein